jgi:hypothetical protein
MRDPARIDRKGLTESAIRRIVREELRKVLCAKAIDAKKRVYQPPCGTRSRMPECMGSAARGPDFCTCPGVRIEYYEAFRSKP